MKSVLNILTVDLEEWYHAEYVKGRLPLRKEDHAKNDVAEALNLLEERGVEATFFVVGELAEKNPELISRIKKNGHEIAFHAYYHEPLWNKTAEAFKQEIIKFSNVVGEPCKGFRAPSFSLSNKTKWVLDSLDEAGFRYDSSIFPARSPLYGVPGAPMKPYKPSRIDVSVEDNDARLWEFPLHVYSSRILRFPMAGGFYLRFFPLKLIMMSIKKSNKDERPAVVYFHTWELTPEIPRLKLGHYRSFVTYHNLEKTASRLEKMLSEFDFTSIENYMKEKGLA